MKRRTFIQISGTTAGLLLLPRSTLGAYSHSLGPPENTLSDMVDAAVSAGARYCDARYHLHRSQIIQLRKENTHSLSDTSEGGFSMRVYYDGGWSSVCFSERDPPNLRALAKHALAMASVNAATARMDFDESNRVKNMRASWETPVEIDPFSIPLEEKIEFLREIATAPLVNPQIPYSVANLFQHRHDVRFVNSYDAHLQQTFMNVYKNFAVTAFDTANRLMDSRSSDREARGGGWEIVQQYSSSEMRTAIQEVMAKQKADSLSSGRFDIVVDSTVLWDLISDTLLPHLDPRRMLERDGVRPGGRWLTPDSVGSKRLASEALTLGWDNTMAGGLATCGWDDAGRPASSGTLIDRGVLINAVASDEIEFATPHVQFTRTSSWRLPAQCAMPNVIVESREGKNLQQLIASVENGLLIRGKGSIVTNPQRTLFRARPQLGWRIRNGERQEMLRDFEIELPVDQFWNSLVEVSSAREIQVAGELFPDRVFALWNQPFSVAAPHALFHNVPVYSSKETMR